MAEIKSENEQVSTKEFLKSVFEFFSFLGKNWQVLLMALLLGTSFDLIRNSVFDKSKLYNGNITFHLELEGNAGQGQLAGLATSFGLPGGGQAQGGDLLGANNFEAIVTSVNVFQNAFMKEVKIGNKTDLFINYFIDSSNIKTKEWGASLFRSRSPYCDYKFQKKKIEDFTPYENLIIADVFNKLSAETRLDARDNSSLFDLFSSTSNEKLTKIWLETLMEATEDFYKEMKTRKTRQLLQIQEKRLDSLSYVLKNNDRKVARVTFDMPNVVDPSAPMKQQQLNRDNTYISNQYYTQLANVENLNRLLYERTPIFTILEPVRLPLTVYSKTGISTRLGGILALIGTLIFISIRKTYLEIIEEEK